MTSHNRPDDPDGELRELCRQIGWRDFILFADEQDGIWESFTKATGIHRPVAAHNPLEAMIDKATGAVGGTMETFIFWVTENLWGLDEAPRAVREAIEKRKGKAKQ